MAMADDTFFEISSIAKARFGLNLSESKRPLVTARLQKRLEVLNLGSFQEYLELIKSSDGHIETDGLVTSLTTNVTQFFREPHHFEMLREGVFPGLIDRALSGGRARIWCAGCSSGQEPYSVAICLAELMPEFAKYNVKILATDIDISMLSKAKEGSYTEKESTGLTDSQIRKFFKKNGDQHQVDRALRNGISFGQLNLIEEYPVKGPFDVIMCRNVAIYFEKETQSEIWLRFSSLMQEGSVLFIGHSERLSPEALEYFEPIGVTAYQRNSK